MTIQQDKCDSSTQTENSLISVYSYSNYNLHSENALAFPSSHCSNEQQHEKTHEFTSHMISDLNHDFGEFDDHVLSASFVGSILDDNIDSVLIPGISDEFARTSSPKNQFISHTSPTDLFDSNDLLDLLR